MSVSRTINHPDVQISERDISEYASTATGSLFLVMGYSDKGEEYEPTLPTSMTDFVASYGSPTNEAERYFYYAAKNIFANGGSVLAAKLPYENTISTNYRFIGLNVDTGTAITSADSTAVKAASSYFTNQAAVSASSLQTLATSAYDTIAAGGDLTSTAGSYDFIIVNENKARLAGTNKDEGIFVVITDMVDGLNVQRMLPNPLDTDVMDVFTGFASPTGVAFSTFTYAPTGTYAGTSLSEDFMRQFPTIEFTSNGNDVDKTYAQWLTVLVCESVEDSNNAGKLNVTVKEVYKGSIHTDAKDLATGQSVYLGDLINAKSDYIKWYGKQNNTASLPTKTDATTVLNMITNSASLLSFTDAECVKKIIGTEIAANMDIVFEKVSDRLEYEIDVAVDAGLSTIAQFTSTNLSGMIYDPATMTSIGKINASTDVTYWRTVASNLITFCSETRKDCMAILDVPRNLVLDGALKYIRKTAPTNTFANVIGNRLRYVSGLNSNYSALYSNWVQLADSVNGVTFWAPQSIKAAASYAYTDINANVWDAPAGLTRGIMSDVLDLSYQPNDKNADQLYLQSINYAKKYPQDGFVIEGQKTTQVKSTAMDRVNVRRLFLNLERTTYKALRYFVEQPNNEYTRRRIVDILTPVFQTVKTAEGLYDYEIVCDSTNNTSAVIDNNELHIAILLKPVRTAEFIVCTFYATPTDADFTELISGI